MVLWYARSGNLAPSGGDAIANTATLPVALVYRTIQTVVTCVVHTHAEGTGAKVLLGAVVTVVARAFLGRMATAGIRVTCVHGAGIAVVATHHNDAGNANSVDADVLQSAGIPIGTR